MAQRGKPSREALYRRLEEAVAQVKSRYGGLPTQRQAADVWNDLWHRDAHNSTAIEGNTLALREVARLLETNETTSRKSLSEYIEVKGYADAATWVYSQALNADERHSNGELVTMQEVRHIHYLVLGPLWLIAPHPHAHDTETPGNFRRHEIAEFPGGMKPPSWTDIDHLMRSWVDEVCAVDRTSTRPFIEAAANTHHSFEKMCRWWLARDRH